MNDQGTLQTIFISSKQDEKFQDETKISEWYSQHILAQGQARERKASDKIRLNPLSKFQLSELKRMTNGMNHYEKRALIEYILEELYEPPVFSNHSIRFPKTKKKKS